MFVRILRDPAVAEAPAGAGSAGTTMPLPDPANAGAPASTFAIPDSYKDRPYLKGVDSIDKVFSMLDGSQKLLGQRPTGVPAPDAKPEEWDKFYETLGRPKDPEEYTFEPTEGLSRDPKLDKAVKASMHKHGLTATQAKGIAKDFDMAVATIVKERGLEAQKNDADFDALANRVFGVQRDSVLATSKTLIDQYTPAEMKEAVAKLPNESLIIMAGVLNNIHGKFIKSDGAPTSGPTATGMTPQDVSAKGREIMSSKAYMDPRDPGHAAAKKAVQDLYSSLNKK